MFKDFLPVLKILARFIIIYMVLLLAYQLYLNQFKDLGIDDFSYSVAKQVAFLQNKFGFPTQLYNDIKHETVYFYVENKYPSRMVEGCNAISVIILFLAFVFAFYKGWKTFVFTGISAIFLHVVNVLRIAGLNILILRFPQYGKAGHDYIFPAIIYGSVVVLWLIWIKFFALKNEVN